MVSKECIALLFLAKLEIQKKIEFVLCLNFFEGCQDIFILAPSTRKAPRYSYLKKLSNKLCQAGLPTYMHVNPDIQVTDYIIQNKIYICTFHGSKGLERSLVFVFQMDRDYHKFTKTLSCPESVNNILYVALTRSKHKLYLMHRGDVPALPLVRKKIRQDADKFWNLFQLIQECDMILGDDDNDDDENENGRPETQIASLSIPTMDAKKNTEKDIIISEWTKYWTPRFSVKCMKFVQQVITPCRQLKKLSLPKIPEEVESSHETFEPVSHLNAKVIFALHDQRAVSNMVKQTMEKAAKECKSVYRSVKIAIFQT
jgi:hypothetical protein